MVTIRLHFLSSLDGSSFKGNFILDVCHPGFVAGRDGSCPSSEPTFVTLWVTALPLIVRPAEVPKPCPGVSGGDASSANQMPAPGLVHGETH